jgi:Mrp family chromosome partitioning ATPase
MAAERFVLLGLAQVRSSWFRDMARWSTTAMVPVEFVKALSVEEVRARLRSGRSFSALLVDDGIVGFDRDLVDLARESGCAVIVVTGDRPSRSWADLGASALLPPGFGRTELLQVLGQVARPIARSGEVQRAPAASDDSGGGFRGHVVTVLGPGGTGASTVAMAIAQGLARDARYAELVCLADLALDADQAMLHGAADVVPGVVELVEAHRNGTPDLDELRRLTWDVRDRGYRLLLGLRRHRDWTAIRPRALDAALDGLRRGFRALVADVDGDLEGESHTGSLDIEERNGMARSAVASADLVVVVGQPGVKGVHAMLRVIRDVVAHGTPGERILPLVNRAPRSPRARAEIASALGDLLSGSGEQSVPSPLHLQERRHLDELVRDGHRLPDAWVAPLAHSVMRLLDREPDTERQARPPLDLVPVQPGSLGRWTEQDGDEALA